jgi:Rrf2 family transcriptional regulator, iron-sulfur cluster assembly transcription factor
MFRISRKLLFAIEAVLDIAYNASDEPVQSTEITRRQGIPRRYLEQVLQQLVRANILAGVRGPRGGYRLARERRRISIGDIVRVVGNAGDGPEPQEEATGSPLGLLVVRPVWQQIQEETMSRLDAISLDELCQRARKAGIERDKEVPVDFSI